MPAVQSELTLMYPTGYVCVHVQCQSVCVIQCITDMSLAISIKQWRMHFLFSNPICSRDKLEIAFIVADRSSVL